MKFFVKFRKIPVSTWSNYGAITLSNHSSRPHLLLLPPQYSQYYRSSHLADTLNFVETSMFSHSNVEIHPHINSMGTFRKILQDYLLLVDYHTLTTHPCTADSCKACRTLMLSTASSKSTILSFLSKTQSQK